MRFGRNTIWLLLVLGIALHVGIAALALYHGAVYQDDSPSYLNLAHNVLTHGSYSQFLGRPEIPDLQRTPGYPAFLLLFAGNTWLIVLVQHLLVLVNAWIVYLIAKQFAKQQHAELAGVAYLLMPYPALFASLILTETFFITLVLLWALAWFRVGQHSSAYTWWVLGMLAGVAGIYVKAILLPAALLAPLVVAGFKRKSYVLAFVSLILTVGCLYPWVARNHAITSKYTLSTLGETALVYGRMGGVVALTEGADFSDATLFRLTDSVLAKRLQTTDFKRYTSPDLHVQETEYFTNEVGREAWVYLAEHPLQALQLQALALWQMLSGVGYRTALFETHSEVLSYTLAAWQFLLNLLLYACVLAAIWFGWRKPAMWALLLLTASFLLAHSAAWADGRYRIICDPFWLILGAWAFIWHKAHK
jgi:4-amino-4-deoxy-L-arabinose transferase-like glycosyltransferase